MIAVELRRQKVRDLLSRQEALKGELNEAKNLLMVDSRTWSFDCMSFFVSRGISITYVTYINL